MTRTNGIETLPEWLVNALAVPAAGLFWLLLRRGAPLDLTTLGATPGAIPGLLSVTVLQFTCNQDIGHL